MILIPLALSSVGLWALLLSSSTRFMAQATIRAEIDTIITSRGGKSQIAYQIVNEDNQTVFEGGDLAAFFNGRWCVATKKKSHHDNDELLRAKNAIRLELVREEQVKGIFHPFGSFSGISMTWNCERDLLQSNNSNTTIIATVLNFDRGNVVLFRLEWPYGALNTTITDDSATLVTFPSFVSPDNTSSISTLLPDTLSWQGSFVQSVRGFSKGTHGGPTVFYNASDPTWKTVIIASPLASTSPLYPNKNYWNTFTASNQQDWSASQKAFSPGTSGRISYIPSGFQQNFILLEGSKGGGMTNTLYEWGTLMQQKYAKQPNQKNEMSYKTTDHITGGNLKVYDVTLEKIGIQTDNGAYYCFCADSKDSNCSDILLKNKNYLEEIGIPIGYLSFQGAGTSSGRGDAAPWCVRQWSADGGQDRFHYPLETKDFQKSLGVPLQLYAPYFCPNSTYFKKDHHRWRSVTSNPELPGCSGFVFEIVRGNDSKPFFTWFLQLGMASGMKSFETDFMIQNANCVEEFVRSPYATDDFLIGMAEAAADLNIPIQWCYASPNEVLSSLDKPAVTNFRVSFDFCYGQSYDIGESSLLVWALGAAPSKDTVWSTDNNRTETPGCKWTTDHETVAAELHVVLALMSTGPFGLSDGIGMSNATLIHRVIAKDGTLLKPSRPITAVDSTFLEPNKSPKGYLYGTNGMALSWIFVSFQLKDSFPVTIRDFWPLLSDESSVAVGNRKLLAYRTFSKNPVCIPGEDAIQSGCVTMVPISATNDGGITGVVFTAPPSNFSTSLPGLDLQPNVVTVWQSCVESGVFFLGELDKYVALSPKRFVALDCTPDGVSATVQGSYGETIELTYLIPQRRVNPWYQIMSKTVTFTGSDIVSTRIFNPTATQD